MCTWLLTFLPSHTTLVRSGSKAKQMVALCGYLVLLFFTIELQDLIHTYICTPNHQDLTVSVQNFPFENSFFLRPLGFSVFCFRLLSTASHTPGSPKLCPWILQFVFLPRDFLVPVYMLGAPFPAYWVWN